MIINGIHISTGNNKLGPIYSFSLPSVVTCKVRTPYCRYCYAAFQQTRKNVSQAYQANLDLLGDLEGFKQRMKEALTCLPDMLRLHVAGDFFSPEYIRAWHDIASELPRKTFTVYTRSWADKTLLSELNRLKSLTGFEVIASVDPSMPLPPKGFRAAFLDIDPRANGFKCLHDKDGSTKCIKCMYCYQPGGDIVFEARRMKQRPAELVKIENKLKEVTANA